MAKPEKPPAEPSPKSTIRHLETVRNGLDNYTTTELVLEGDGRVFKVVERIPIAREKSRNVTTDYVRDWWLARVGSNGTGDFT